MHRINKVNSNQGWKKGLSTTNKSTTEHFDNFLVDSLSLFKLIHQEHSQSHDIKHHSFHIPVVAARSRQEANWENDIREMFLKA